MTATAIAYLPFEGGEFRGALEMVTFLRRKWPDVARSVAYEVSHVVIQALRENDDFDWSDHSLCFVLRSFHALEDHELASLLELFVGLPQLGVAFTEPFWWLWGRDGVPQSMPWSASPFAMGMRQQFPAFRYLWEPILSASQSAALAAPAVIVIE